MDFENQPEPESSQSGTSQLHRDGLHIFIYPACQVQGTRVGTWPHWFLWFFQAPPGVLQAPTRLHSRLQQFLSDTFKNLHHFL